MNIPELLKITGCNMTLYDAPEFICRMNKLFGSSDTVHQYSKSDRNYRTLH